VKATVVYGRVTKATTVFLLQQQQTLVETLVVERRRQYAKINSTIQGVHVERKVETQRGNYCEFYDNLHHAIRDQKALAIQPEEAKEVIRLIEVCYESNKLKRAIGF